jgi:hypothetical protein
MNPSQQHLRKYALGSLAALFIATIFAGCNYDRCEDKGPAAIQALLPHLTPDMVSNLVREASLCIADSAAQPVVVPSYTPTTDKAPVAYGLKVESPTEFRISMGPFIAVRNHGTSSPYMAIGVPVHLGSGLCLWSVYVCVKPGGGFAKDNPTWVIAEGKTNAAPVVKLSNEIVVYAEQRRFE